MRQFYGIGVAVALGEIPLERIAESDICANYSLYSSVASTSSGVELQNCEIIVLGNSPQSASDYDVSGGSEHQGPPGGGPVAAIASTHSPANTLELR
ncbi:hypothetical protein H6G20_18310 [Desertifilum sp. FACHB-1129]|uniref:Uncharacterized protein n=1 Tax=Desertifilum tharense IPPAS B-1220 TaxID=1781255 RepID=A0A1E5QIH1_9CYAN|nr:ring-opening amidohydrolase [Desertifilum tharense]MBD2313625.1 hypothetical protein [Desertifilum sp. FACHB-1129]MBD2320554.1 hypothetical protein [Desertifilum sp. FACHB-866]MBD2330682.1 hypothetical protein [Desertifilum sp. FACHB-868]OEJ74479.1 hypothetical protein BH720_14755 [Desertifilum tharense IPPAS B-1220]